MKKSEKTGEEKDLSIKDSRKALQNWLSIDFDKTTRSNKGTKIRFDLFLFNLTCNEKFQILCDPTKSILCTLISFWKNLQLH